MAGSAGIVATGGMESMSNAPYLLAKARGGYRAGHDRLSTTCFWMAWRMPTRAGRAMGDFGEATAQAINSPAASRMPTPSRP